MTESRSDAPEAEDTPTDEDSAALAEWADQLGSSLGATSVTTEHDTVRVYVDRERWTEAITTARDEHDLIFFSWLAGVDWSKEVTVGEEVADPDSLDERYEVICRLSSIESSNGAHIIATLPKDDPTIASLVPLFGGASWHERETAEMYGIEFIGHPGLDHLYLPDAFEGHPLRKSFPLLAREVKPWPGMVDVEGMPSTENVEADAMTDAVADADAGDDA